ncbi:MAG TPA: 3-dehydroquinate synthase [Burkholderiales bacterium]|nr:3-dehydroquinate synthase [Burkholderiales bacterium]
MKPTTTTSSQIIEPGPSSAVYHQRFAVQYDYPVHFTHDLFSRDNPVFVDALSRKEPNKRHRFLAFIDADVAASWPALAHDICAYAEHHGERLQLLAHPETIVGGEQVKHDPDLVTRLQRRLLDLGVDRHAYVVAIGGGAFLDMAGFVAATVHRGVRHVRVPTTVLSQNDSGVGVKNGISSFGVKNFVGSFAPPFAVLNDANFLRTLHPRDRIAGIAEAVKVSLIRDAVFFEWLESQVEALHACVPEAMARMIRRCAELHMRQIAHGGDPFETGSARPLDYGHWSAHKLEALTAHELRHGEAVAIGIALDSRYSVQIGMLAPGQEERVFAMLKRLGFYLWHPALERRDPEGRWVVLEGLREFREHLGGELTITLLREIGRGEEVHVMDEAEILRAIAWLRHREAAQ